MRLTPLVALMLILAPAAPARAQVPPAAPTGGGYPAPPPTRMRIDVGLGAASPQGDYEGVATSPELHAAFGYSVIPSLSLHVFFRYILVQPEEDIPGLDASYYELGVGGRYALPVGPQTELFGELNVMNTTAAVDYMGQSDSESEVGFGIRAGGVFLLSRTLGIGGSLGYSSAEYPENFDAVWTTVEAHASFRF